MPEAGDILKKMQTMKTLPNIAVRLTRMISEDDGSLEAFEEVIRLDPTLVLRLLKIVNSPFYALAAQVESIAEAVAFVGMDNLRNLIVMDICRHLVKAKPEGDGFSRVRLWRHSAAVGVTSQMVSERIFETKGENAFLCGLIHDIGLIVEDQVEATLFEQAYEACEREGGHITVFENRLIGTDHTLVGAEIARDWFLPQEVVEGIQGHHKDQGPVSPQSLRGTVQMAEYLVGRMGLTPFKGMLLGLPQELINHIHSQIGEYKSICLDLPDLIKKADEVFGLDEP